MDPLQIYCLMFSYRHGEEKTKFIFLSSYASTIKKRMMYLFELLNEAAVLQMSLEGLDGGGAIREPSDR